MGNQISVKKNDHKATKSFSSQLKVSDTYVYDSSTISASKPKFGLECFPSDEVEVNRQRGEHFMFKHVFQVSYFAPIEDILKQPNSTALDIGCGAQPNWLIDVANDFPECTFHGFDIVETHDDAVEHIPKNCILKQHDLLDGFCYDDDTFDYVHQRMMHWIYPVDKIPWMFNELLRVTKPNGWIELVEPDSTPKRVGPLFGKLLAALRLYLNDNLGDVLQGKALEKKMIEYGLVDVKTDYGSLPVCWGGYVGKMVYEDILAVMEHLGPSLYCYLDFKGEYNKAAFDTYVDSAFNECVEYQTFFNVQWAYGRKPN